MTTWLTYLIITALLLAAELVYFRIADKCNIIDKYYCPLKLFDSTKN